MRKVLLSLAVLVVVGAACAEEEPTAQPTPEATEESPAGSPTAESPTADACAKENLPLTSAGVLTVGTSQPAFPPYVLDNDPTSGTGFESAVSYEVASRLGFAQDEVTWIRVPFGKSFAPGPKDFDFYLAQVSIRPKRDEAVDFSVPYYTSNQALIALKTSPIADATSIADLADARLGAEIGTTSLAYIQEVIQPSEQARVYDTTSDAKSALEAERIDGIVVDLPTAYFITAVEIPKATIVGQFTLESGGATDEWGLVFEEGNALRDCVNQALEAMTADGTLDAITEEWMSGGGAVPVLQ